MSGILNRFLSPFLGLSIEHIMEKKICFLIYSTLYFGLCVHKLHAPQILNQGQLSGRVAQSVGHLTRKSGPWVRYPVWQHTFVSPSAFSRRAVVSYWRKYVHEVLINRLGGLSLPRKGVVRLTDRPDMTLDVYRGRKTTIQQQQQGQLFKASLA